MQKTLRSRKQDLVRDTIYEAAIDLFTAKGFDETTVEEVAQAAGVSRRSFFRYYASKDDLLAQSVLDYGDALVAAIKLCPAGFHPMKVLQNTVAAGVDYNNLKQALVRRVVEIASRSKSARQAHLSRMVDVEDALADAFAGRLKKAHRNNMEPRLLSGLTIAIMNATLASWFTREHKDLTTSSQHAFIVLSLNVCALKLPSPKTSPSKRSKPNRDSIALVPVR